MAADVAASKRIFEVGVVYAVVHTVLWLVLAPDFGAGELFSLAPVLSVLVLLATSFGGGAVGWWCVEGWGRFGPLSGALSGIIAVPLATFYYMVIWVAVFPAVFEYGVGAFGPLLAWSILHTVGALFEFGLPVVLVMAGLGAILGTTNGPAETSR